MSILSSGARRLGDQAATRTGIHNLEEFVDPVGVGDTIGGVLDDAGDFLSDAFTTEEGTATATTIQTAGLSPEQIAAINAVNTAGTGLLGTQINVDPNIAAASQAAARLNPQTAQQVQAAQFARQVGSGGVDPSALIAAAGRGAQGPQFGGGLNFDPSTNAILQGQIDRALRQTQGQAGAQANLLGAAGSSDDMNLRAQLSGSVIANTLLPLLQEQAATGRFQTGLTEQSRQADIGRQFQGAQSAANLQQQQRNQQLAAAGLLGQLGGQQFGQNVGAANLLGQTGQAAQNAGIQATFTPFQQVAGQLGNQQGTVDTTTTQVTPTFRNQGAEAVEALTGVLGAAGSLF